MDFKNTINKLFIIKFNLNFDFLFKKKILIYSYKDNKLNFDFIKKKFKKKIFHLHINEYNMIIFLLAFIKTIFSKDKIFIHNYLKILIYLSKIEVLISDLDNYTYLWRLKNKISNIKVLLIQNAIRGGKWDVFNNLKKDKNFAVDDFIVFSDSIKKKYQNYIKAKYHVFGSYRLSNFLDNLKTKKIKKVPKFDVIFISQYKRFPESKKFLQKKMLDRDFKVIKFLEKYCLENNLIFKINLRPKNISKENFEKKYYEDMGIAKDKILWPENSFDSYNNIFKARLVTAFNSTMGYESLSLYKKTIFLPIIINHSTPNLFQEFGWPKKIKREGFFWSTKFSKSRLKKMIANIFKLDNKRWIFKLNKFKKDIFFLDKFFSKKTNNIIISYFK